MSWLRWVFAALLLASPALGQTPGTLNLSGPSTGGRVVTPATINAAVNSQLGLKADATSPVFSGVATMGSGAQSKITFTPGATTSIAPVIASSGTAGMQLNGGTAGVAIVGGGPLVSNNGMTLTRSLAVAGAMPTSVNWTWNMSGTTTTPTPPSLVTFQTNSDTVAALNPGSDQIRVMSVFQNFGGPTMTGARTAFLVKGTGIAASGNPGVGVVPNYQAVAFSYQQNVSEGGVGTSQGATVGDLFAGGSTLRLTPSATGFHEATGWEADMALAVPVYKKFGWKITQTPNDIAQGALDGAFVIENGGTSANNGWHNGFLAIEPNGAFPYATDGWIINAPLAGDFATFNTMAGGINIVDPTFTTGAIRSRNFLIDGLGTVRVGNGYLAKTAGGVSLDAGGSVGPDEGTTLSGAAIVSGGTTGFSTGMTLYDPYGGTWTAATTAGGVVLSVTCLRTPYFASATPPSNPVTLTPGLIAFGNTTGALTVNLTWTQPNTLAIQPSGGPTTIGGTLAVTGAITGYSTTAQVAATYAPLASPTFTGAPVAPTAAPGTTTTQLATTAFSAAAIAVETSRATTAEALLAPKASPTFTGAVTIPAGASISGFAALAGATFTGTLNVGNNTTTQALNINGPAGIGRVLVWNTAAVKRWQLFATATAEGGANAGSDFAINAYDDTGTLLFTPLTITRSTGLFNFATALKFSGTNIVANGAIATTMTSLGPTGSHTTIQEWLTIQNASGVTRYIPLY